MSATHTLAPGEPHPASDIALRYLRPHLCYPRALEIQEALCSCAIEGNRLAEICAETFRRLLAHEPVSDRYLMGLAWPGWLRIPPTPRTCNREGERMTTDHILVERVTDGECCSSKCPWIANEPVEWCCAFNESIPGYAERQENGTWFLRCPSCLSTPSAVVLTPEMVESVKRATKLLCDYADKTGQYYRWGVPDLAAAFPSIFGGAA